MPPPLHSSSAFSRSDLDALLPTSAGDLHSLRHTADDTELAAEEAAARLAAAPPRAGGAAVRRYRAADDDGSDDYDDGEGDEGGMILAANRALRKKDRAGGIPAPASAPGPRDGAGGTSGSESESDSDSGGVEEDVAARRARARARAIERDGAAPAAGDGRGRERGRVEAVVVRRARPRVDSGGSGSDSGSDSSSSRSSSDGEGPGRGGAGRSRAAAPRAEASPPTPVPSPPHQPTAPAGKGDSDSDSSDSDSSSSSSSGSDTESSSESDVAAGPSVRPIFVPRSRRTGGAGAPAAPPTQAGGGGHAARKSEYLARRKVESRAMVAASVRHTEHDARGADGSMAAAEGEEAGIPLPDPEDDSTDDDGDENGGACVGHDLWKLREIMRILQKQDAQDERAFELSERERRRKMTDREVMEEDGPAEKKARSKGAFMQRYYHRGAYYMDDDTLRDESDVRNRTDFWAPTLEDKVNKKNLPEVMQVKKFGIAGYSTKYKGLAKEDTTDKNLQYLPILNRPGGGPGGGDIVGGPNGRGGTDGRRDGGDRGR